MSAGLVVTPIPVLLLVDGAIDGPRAEVVEVAAMVAIRHACGQLATHEPVEKLADVLAVAQRGKREVLPPQTVAAVQRHERHEARLSRRQMQRRQRLHAIIEGHTCAPPGGADRTAPHPCARSRRRLLDRARSPPGPCPRHGRANSAR